MLPSAMPMLLLATHCGTVETKHASIRVPMLHLCCPRPSYCMLLALRVLAG